MNAQQLIDTAGVLVAGDKGLLAMDESNPTCTHAPIYNTIAIFFPTKHLIPKLPI